MEILIEGSLDYCEVKEWKKRYFVMKYEISSGLRYIEIYKDKNWRKQLPRHVVNLHPGYEVRRKEDPKKRYCFSVKTTDHCLFLASDDENITNQWMATLEEYNLVKSYCVQPQDTPTMIRIEAIYPCHLQLVHSEVRLVSAMDGKLLGLWPFKCIRRYKFMGNVFTLEAGRKAPTGEGMFEFISNECSEIYRVMDTIIRTKAGSPTMRRLASEKMQQHQKEGRHPVRKTQSAPFSPPPTKTKEVHYDYADPKNDIASRSNTFSPPQNLPSLPTQPPPFRGNMEPENNYDVLSPGEASPDQSQFCKPDNRYEESYDTLQFGKSSEKDRTNQAGRSSAKVSASPGCYDTLKFEETPPASKSKNGEYDKLNFGNQPQQGSHLSPSVEEVSSLDDSVNHNTLRSGGLYNTLSRLEESHAGGTPQNTYDSLGDVSSLGRHDTYDCLGETIPDGGRPSTLNLGSTYDQLHDTHRQGTPRSGSPVGDQDHSQEKPSVPQRPPPRKKAPKSLDKVSSRQKPVAPCKPARPMKPPRKAPAAPKGGEESPATNAQPSLSVIIQNRLAKPAEDDGNYASIDHDYASVDYSKVSKPESNAAPFYAEPCDAECNDTTSNSQKAAKPKRKPPMAMKNLFKKGTPTPKAKASGEGEGKFADELKKKLEIKLKKSDGRTAKGSKSALPTQAQGNPDDGIYDEVDNTNSPTYSEVGFDKEMNV